MRIVTRSAPMAALLAFMVFIPAVAGAQDQRLRVSFTPSAATVNGDAELAWAGSLGYRFSEHFWFEGDFTWIDAAAGGFRDRDLAAYSGAVHAATLTGALRGSPAVFGRGNSGLSYLVPFPAGATTIFPAYTSFDGSTTIGTIGMRYEVPVQTARFRPYLAGGLGLNRTQQEFRIDATALTMAVDESVSHTGYAFNAGAGASVRVFNQLWADVDAKYFRLSRERNIMRLGGGVSLRF